MVTPFVELGKTGDDPAESENFHRFCYCRRPSKLRQSENSCRGLSGCDRKDGLATWILIDDWESPAEIRALLKELYEDRRMPLEGTVFVGDIPVPMIRDAQFLSSAFKMDQKRPWDQSSIPSDRYYDDFGLQFDFLKQDSIQPLYFIIA